MSSTPQLKKKAINLICSIGQVNISRRAIKSLEIERNFSDVSNKFSMILIDTPQTSITDLELYMCGGSRNISFSYNDNPDSAGFIAYKGQIWDYTSSFVGNIKQLSISGNVTKTIYQDNSGTALYNIDWNNYFCMRSNTKKIWNINSMLLKSQKIQSDWEVWNEVEYGDARDQYTVRDSNVTAYKNFAADYNLNAITVKIQGPGGSIDLPVPDSFATMVNDQRDKTEKGKKKYSGDENDPRHMLWGKLTPIYIDPSNGSIVSSPSKEEKEQLDIFWRAKSDGSIRAFRLVGNDPYIQLNPSKQYYGSGSFLNSDLGVDPSYIVKQLCILEGWKFSDSTIVQTEMVPNSDSFKMNNQSAIQFISEVLAPVSITPAGYYTDKSGHRTKVTSGATGFSAWFDSSGVFHYEPLTNLYKQDRRSIPLGYNIPNSPVISFQVDTKGTAFYTTNAQEINSIFITTGQQVSSIDTTAMQLQDEYNKVKGHNEKLDEFFGFTYEEIQAKYEKADNSSSNDFYLGFGDASISANTSRANALATSTTSGNSDYTDLSNDTGSVKIVSSAVQSKLVTSLISSGVSNATTLATQLKTASNKIEEFMITATLNMWGDTRLSPASLINVVNMVKSTNSNEVERHPTSGNYLILKQVDKIANDSFTQTLSLIRANAALSSNINPQNIDYSKGVERLNEKTSSQIKSEQRAKQLVDTNVNQVNKNNQVISDYLNLWSEYMEALKKHKFKYWSGATPPPIWEDIKHLNFYIYYTIKVNASDRNYNIILLKAGKSLPDKSWYRFKTPAGTSDMPGLEKGEIVVDEYIKKWYTKASKYKKKGKLGTKVLHYPTYLTPAGMAKFKLDFDADGMPK